MADTQIQQMQMTLEAHQIAQALFVLPQEETSGVALPVNEREIVATVQKDPSTGTLLMTKARVHRSLTDRGATTVTVFQGLAVAIASLTGVLGTTFITVARSMEKAPEWMMISGIALLTFAAGLGFTPASSAVINSQKTDQSNHKATA